MKFWVCSFRDMSTLLRHDQGLGSKSFDFTSSWGRNIPGPAVIWGWGKDLLCNSRTWAVKDFQSWSVTSSFYLVWLPWTFDQFPWSRFQCHPSLIKSVFLDLGSNHQYFLNLSGDSNVRPRLKSSILSIYCVTGERITWFLLY